MKSIFDQITRHELIGRINSLSESNSAQWGRMSLYQMIRHCIQWQEMILGKKQYRQSFPGRLFGKWALKDMLKDEPMKKDLPTVPSFKITGTGDVAIAKDEWINLIQQHDLLQTSGFVHPFFGKLTAEQAGIMAYKHMDHHLRQFNS